MNGYRITATDEVTMPRHVAQAMLELLRERPAHGDEFEGDYWIMLALYQALGIEPPSFIVRQAEQYARRSWHVEPDYVR